MATLRRASDGVSFTLPARCPVGRGLLAALRLEDPRVSQGHAEVAFADGRWTLRDLGSRNGTRVDGDRVRGPVTLAVGQQVAFGRRDAVWEVADVEPPVAMAADLDTGDFIVAEGGVLALPDGQTPRLTILADGGVWVVEQDWGRRPTATGRVVELGARAWRLYLPEPPDETAAPAVRVEVTCSDAAEFVAVALEGPAGRVELPPRGHHAALLALARARLDDAHLAAADQGWRPPEAIAPAAALLALRRELVAHGLPAATVAIYRGRVRLAVPPERLALR
ncbi:MAG: FHA domain-containing protein [Myxococcales bacterium]|nr:FHA domain-containing protein [Myxococcales bacterium]